MRAGVFLVPALVFVCMQAGIAMATPNPDTGPGCGLGKKLWEGWKGQKQIAPQLFMASTNVIGSYSFAIASGTSGCSHDGTIFDTQKASLFIEVNYARLAEDMARGGGEYLASLAVLMHVPQEYQAELFQRIQDRYAALTTPADHGPDQIREIVRAAIAVSPVLTALKADN